MYGDPIIEVGESSPVGVSGLDCGTQQGQPMPLQLGPLVGVLGEQPCGTGRTFADEAESGPAVLGDDGFQPCRVVRSTLCARSLSAAVGCSPRRAKPRAC